MGTEDDLGSGRAWDDLLGGVRDALAITPPDYVASVFGPRRDWLPPHEWYSEYGLVEGWRPLRALGYLADVLVPSVPRTPWPFVPPVAQRLFWHPTRVLQRPDHIGSYTSHLDESWLFVNGILTNDTIAHRNAAYLSYLCHRPVTLVQNSTGGLVEDLWECVRDKATGRISEAATKAFPPLYDALADPGKHRVVLVAHSQGTIIASVLLRFTRRVLAADTVPAVAAAAPEEVPGDDIPLDPADFAPLTAAEIGKLEVYCFGNCATSMRYVAKGPDGPVPWIESYGNDHDVVARLGVLAPRPGRWQVHIDGPRYRRAGAWGHLLNEHYLAPIAKVQRHGRRRGPFVDSPAPYALVNATEFPQATVPRLYRYLNGGAPTP